MNFTVCTVVNFVVCREFPGQLTKILEWFRDYKIPDGKPANAFGYDNKCMDKAFTLKVGCDFNVCCCLIGTTSACCKGATEGWVGVANKCMLGTTSAWTRPSH
jgi:hypothetical protein